MRSRETAFKGGQSGEAAIVPGQPEKSPLCLSVTRQHEDEWAPMPPKEADKLYAEQIAWIKDWIAAGAPWPDEAKAREIAKANAGKWAAEDGAPVKTSGGLSPEWSNRKYKPESLWGYQEVKKPDSETIRQGDNELHPVDALVAIHLPKELKPAGDTDARTFIRRARFDLTGLPPTPEEVDAFVTACSGQIAPSPDLTVSLSSPQAPKAIEALINRLLESPHYGERMAQHWLDVARYADSSGFANDYERGNAWRYRDYVVRRSTAISRMTSSSRNRSRAMKLIRTILRR